MYYMENTLGKYFDILNLSLFLSHFLFLFEDPATDGLVNRLKFPSQHFLNWPWVFTHTRRHAHAHKVMCWFVTRYRREEHLFSLHPQYTHTCSLKNYKQIQNARTHLIFSLALSLCAWSMLWVPPLCDCVCVGLDTGFSELSSQSDTRRRSSYERRRCGVHRMAHKIPSGEEAKKICE